MRSEHRKHDRLLVTRYATDDAYPSEVDEARALVESCADCAALAADIRTISSSMAALPAPKRTRDFAITQEQAEQLRGNRLSRWLRGLATPGVGVLRPVAGVALSIGLVMAVVGTQLPNTAPGADSGTGLGPQAVSTQGAPAEVPDVMVPQPTSAMAPEMAPPASDTGGREGPNVAEVDKATQDPVSEELNQAYVSGSPSTGAGGESEASTRSPSSASATNLLFYGGLAIAMLSVALLALAWFARRYFTDPLLR